MKTRAFLAAAAAIAILAAAPGAIPPSEGLPPPPDIPDPNPARQVMREAQKAALEAKAITFTFRYYAVGSLLEQSSPRLTAQVRMRRSEQNEWEYRGTGRGRLDAGKPETEFDAAWRGTIVEYLDHASRKLYSRPVAQARGNEYRLASTLRPLTLFELVPYQRDLNARSYTFLEPAEFDGVLCDVVELEGAGRNNREHVRWWIGREDRLPRKHELIFSGANLSASIFTELTEVRQLEWLPGDEVRIELPEGYELDAIDPVRPAPTVVQPDGEPRPPTVVTPAQPAPPPPPRVEYLPDVTVRTAADEKLSLADLKGSVVVLDFFGTWCLTCRAWHDDLKSIAERYRGRPVRFFSLAVREKESAAARNYMKNAAREWELLLAGDEAAAALKVYTFPTLIVADATGAIVLRADNFKQGEPPASIAEAIERAIAAQAREAEGASAKEHDAGGESAKQPDQPTKDGT